MSMIERDPSLSGPNNIRENVYPLDNAVERWANAPITILPYVGGTVRVPDGGIYRFNAGRRLIIDGHAVMDTCESPWADATVEKAFDMPVIQSLSPTFPLKVLERGAGLQVVANRVINRLSLRRGGGEYHVIELNKTVAEKTKEWAVIRQEELNRASRDNGAPNVKIFVHEGEAAAVSRRLIEEEDKKFNIILSDTYPLMPTESGVNDILDIDVLKNGVYRGNGVFGFFSFTPKDPSGELTAEQYALLNPHFKTINKSEVAINPSLGYDYLFFNGIPIRNLPVVICSDRK